MGLATGAGAFTFGGGGAALGIGVGLALVILTGGLGAAFGAGANLAAGLVVLMLGLVGGAFKAATFGARDLGLALGFATRRRLEVFALLFPGRFSVTLGRSLSANAPATGGRFTKSRDLGILEGGSSRPPVRLGSGTKPPAGDGPMPLSPRTLRSTKTSLLESHGRNCACAELARPITAITAIATMVSQLAELFWRDMMSFPLHKDLRVIRLG